MISIKYVYMFISDIGLMNHDHRILNKNICIREIKFYKDIDVTFKALNTLYTNHDNHDREDNYIKFE